MKAHKQRGSKVIYVAASAKELPADVQDWLSHSGQRVGASPHIYDALASLATGKRPAAIIVSIHSVDWNELEFFDHAQRLSRKTSLYVTGDEHEQAKLEAACDRGARLFDVDAIAADLHETVAQVQKTTPVTHIGPAGLLAGSLRVEQSTVAAATARPAAVPKIAVSGPGIELEDSDTESDEQAPPMRPAVRLVTATEQEEPPAVPFPWNPSPDRPQRTPPRRTAPESATPASSDLPQSVKLTTEELDALLGKPAAREERR